MPVIYHICNNLNEFKYLILLLIVQLRLLAAGLYLWFIFSVIDSIYFLIVFIIIITITIIIIIIVQLEW